ncbi:hypothetical protein EDC01DRAFT_661502 [Geopyxis carbonaria]|nr:hypothetical protein EDC01DRAFT_661502 [Geopyxis carbonaria]
MHNMDICPIYLSCIRSFETLCKTIRDPGTENNLILQLPISAVEDEIGRLRVWAENLGAHRSGRMSLDYRLREASSVKQEVLDLLEELHSSINNANSILSGEKTSHDTESLSSISSDEEDEFLTECDLPLELQTKTEVEEASIEIAHIITCLYNFSITIRNPAPRDRLQKCGSINVSHFEFFDIQHVLNKYPFAGNSVGRKDNYLVERFGRANTKRRQLLEYHKKHHQKLARLPVLNSQLENTIFPVSIDAQNVDESKENERFDELEILEAKAESRCIDQSQAPPTIYSQTTLSTFVHPLFQRQVLADHDENSDAGISQTSYASTSSGGQHEIRIRVPPPPNEEKTLDGEPFECPYCFSIKKIESMNSWTRHVFRDLRPYVCTFKDCAKPDQLYETRHDWFEHELNFHRKEWFCNICKNVFVSNFKQHLIDIHSDILAPDQINNISNGCQRATVSNQQCSCPFCGKSFETGSSTRRLRSHLARHMQQIALFVLPRNFDDFQKDEGSVRAQKHSISDLNNSSQDSISDLNNSSQERSEIQIDALKFSSNTTEQESRERKEHEPREEMIQEEREWWARHTAKILVKNEAVERVSNGQSGDWDVCSVDESALAG